MDKKDSKRIPAQVELFTAEGKDANKAAENLKQKINKFIEDNASIILGIEYSVVPVVLESVPSVGERPQTLVFSALLTYKE